MPHSDAPTVSLILHSDLLEENNTGNASGVLIDVVRFSSSVVTALARGAIKIIPVATPEEALQLKKREKDCILAGEFMAQKLEGFDINNSPATLMKMNITGKTLIMCTTNGTRTLQKMQTYREVVIASFLNLSAVAKYLEKIPHRITIVCCGKRTEEKASFEDILAGMLLVKKLRGKTLSEMAHFFAACTFDFSSLKMVLEASPSIRRVRRSTPEENIEYLFQQDLYDGVPVYNPATGEIKLALNQRK